MVAVPPDPDPRAEDASRSPAHQRGRPQGESSELQRLRREVTYLQAQLSSLERRPTHESIELQRLRREVSFLRGQIAERQGDATSPQAQQIAFLETELRKDEKFVQALLQNLTEGIIACDAKGHITLFNAAAHRILRWSTPPKTAQDWMTGCTLHTATSEPITAATNPLQLALQGQSIQDFEVAITDATGEHHQVLINGDPIVDPQGEWAGAVIALREITRFRQATQALQERESFLRTIYNGIENGIFMLEVDAEGTLRFLGLNPAHERLTGLRSLDLQGQTPEAVLPPDIASAVSSRYRQCLTARQPISYEECLTLQGQKTWWLTTLHPLINEQGQIYRIIGTSLEITRRKQAEEQAQQLNAELEKRVADRTRELTQLNSALLQTTALLERRNKELDQFVYAASHDLKAPLRAIANLSCWLEEDLGTDLPSENQEQMQLLRGRVNRMEALINGLLEYSRAGRTEVQPEIVDLAHLLDEVIDSLDPPETFTFCIDCDVLSIRTKRVPLHQVFANLISNAIKHCDRPDGRIQITCIDTGDTYRFAITDNGPGIDPKYHERIFGVFQTLKARDQKESTGIGLAIVKKVLDTEGGRIEVASTLGEGTTFTVNWPKSIK